MSRRLASSKSRRPGKSRRDALFESFEKLWAQLFTTPIHLDSALSKAPDNLKSTLAQLIQPILLRPASSAETLGIGVPAGEPWSLPQDELSRWRTAALLAEKLYGRLAAGALRSEPVREDFPPCILQETDALWGREVTDELVGILAREAPLSLRVNRKATPQGVLDALSGGSRLPVKASRSEMSPRGLTLSGYAPVLQTDLFKEGAFEVQDEGSQIMAYFLLWPEIFGRFLQERPGRIQLKQESGAAADELPPVQSSLTLVDACAGAGGKALALGDAIRGKGRIFAYDISSRKLQALKRRAVRAGLNNIQGIPIEEGCEDQVVEKFRGRADRVLVDAPCSGWGVLRRNPDIKWRIQSETLDRMSMIQGRLLHQYSGLVAPGGRLVYGVCTFRISETREVVQAFLETHPEFEPGPGGFLGPGPTDGFFMQAFERKR